MPRSSCYIKAARFAPILGLGAGSLLGAGCGPPERGSVKPPAELSRGAKPGYDPGRAKAGLQPAIPGKFQPAPKPPTAKGPSKTSRPPGR